MLIARVSYECSQQIAASEAFEAYAFIISCVCINALCCPVRGGFSTFFSPRKMSCSKAAFFVNRECHSITLTRFHWILSTLHKYNAKVVSYSKIAIVFSNVTLTLALELTCNNCVVRKISPLLDSTDQCTISLTRSTLEQSKDLKVG